MPSIFGRLAKDAKHNNNSNISTPERPPSPSPSPRPSRIAVPDNDLTPKVILTKDDDSTSPMTVSPTSLHRADSFVTSTENGTRNSSKVDLPAGQHKKYATVSNDELAPRSHIASSESLNQQESSNATGGATGQLTESPTQSLKSRRSGSIGSSESTHYQSIQPLIEPPNGINVPRQRAISSTISDRVSEAPSAKASKRKNSRYQGSVPGSPPYSPSILARATGKPQARHQSTMGMGLASALAASGMGIAPPPSLLVPPPGSAASGSASGPKRKNSGISINNITSSPELGTQKRLREASISSPGGPTSGDDSDYDSGDGLSFNDDDIPIAGFAVATAKRNQDFHELFPTVPFDDYLIDDYGCALQRDILIQGRLYISENHLCFHANIFGWVTHLIIPFVRVTSIEKKMTAYVIPNAIGITEHGQKHTFASFLARDTAYDVIYNIWKHAGPDRSTTTSPENYGRPDSAGAEQGGARTRKATQCACLKSNTHYPNSAMEAVFLGTPEQIYSLLFASGFIKDFLAHDQHLIDIQVSDWQPSTANTHLLSRNMSYIKPLAGGFGPKQTKCELRDENQHVDYDNYVSTITTTRTPDVPSGGSFCVKTRTCIMWAGSSSSKIIVTYTIEWTGTSFLKAIIEKSVGDGQRAYYNELEQAMRKYIAAHRSEFVSEGVDADAAQKEAEAEKAALGAASAADSTRIEKSSITSARGLQWALDTFEGASKVATESFSGALEIIGDVIGGMSHTSLLGVAIIGLLFTNIYTFVHVGDRTFAPPVQVPDTREDDRERWVGDAVKAFLEVQKSLGFSPTPTTTVYMPGVETSPTTPIRLPDTFTSSPEAAVPYASLKEELAELKRAAAELEAQVAALRSQLDELD